MNVHVNQVVGGIYQLALMERLKYNSNQVVAQRYMANLPMLVMPSVMQYYEKDEYVLFLRNTRINFWKNNRYVFPAIPEGEAKKVPMKDIELLTKEMDLAIFKSTNFVHSGYHAMKAHLMIRQMLYKVLASYVNIKFYGGKIVYRALYDGTILTEEEMETEIAIFEEAVLIFIANVMKSRYHQDGKEIGYFCFERIKQDFDPNVSGVWVDEMLKAISVPERVQQQLVSDDYSLSVYESKLCGRNLSNEVAKFVMRAYEAVYAEI